MQCPPIPLANIKPSSCFWWFLRGPTFPSHQLSDLLWPAILYRPADFSELRSGDPPCMLAFALGVACACPQQRRQDIQRKNRLAAFRLRGFYGLPLYPTTLNAKPMAPPTMLSSGALPPTHQAPAKEDNTEWLFARQKFVLIWRFLRGSTDPSH